MTAGIDGDMSKLGRLAMSEPHAGDGKAAEASIPGTSLFGISDASAKKDTEGPAAGCRPTC
jgi:hypothetical protein